MSFDADHPLLPFLWLHGEDDDTLRRGIRDIYDTGCRLFCAESRVHPDFLGASWWHEMAVLLDESRRLGMRFYLLDDTQFPSGYANGAGADTPWQRMMLTEKHVDIRGPRAGGSLLIWPDGMKGMPVAAVAGRKTGPGNWIEGFVDQGGFAVDSLIDLTDRVTDGLLRWDVPEGDWRLFLLTADYVSERSPARKFLNPLLPESGRLMIDTIYRPHADFFGEESRKTFLGFFSDEPALRSGRGSHAVLGEYPGLPVAWRKDMPAMLSQKMGRDARAFLPGLWYDIGEATPRIRYAYMDLVSGLYARHYSQAIGAWCVSRGLEYTGHVIEQNNAHSRLGQGAGHFFRAISGQTMAGMDLVLHELRPEFYGGWHAWHSQDHEGEDDFFRFMLPQMTASAAALDPKKRGRALCEVFGAYGWQEDVGEMRYLAHLLLSRGINRFTPHAFSLKPAPDPDSPPHFGRDMPLEPFVARLFGEMEEVARMIDSGRHVARAAVLYYAEAEWASGSSVMKSQRIVRVLNERQIACEVVPIELLEPGRYEALLIPAAPRWPRGLFDRLLRLRDSGCAVAFVDERPIAYCDADGTPPVIGDCIPLPEAAGWCASVSRPAVVPLRDAPMVHVYPYDSPRGRLVLFFNEDSREDSAFEGWIEGFDGYGDPVLYDPEDGRCIRPDGESNRGGYRLTLRLTPGQLLILSAPRPGWPSAVSQVNYQTGDPQRPLWRVSFPGQERDMPAFETAAPRDITARWPRFSGTVRYEGEIDCPRDADGILAEGLSGAARLWIDGEEAGVRVAVPYRFPRALNAGRHRLRLEVTNAPVYRWRDPLSIHAWLPPTGLTGCIQLLYHTHEEEQA